MSLWDVHVRRIPMRPDASGFYSSGHWLPRVQLEAVDADTAGRLGHELAGLGVPGVTRVLVDVVTPDTEPVHTITWWLNGSKVGALPVRRVTSTNGRTTAAGQVGDSTSHLCDRECGDDSHPRDGRVVLEGRASVAWVMEDGREWLRVTRSPDTGRWSAPTSDVVEVPAHMRRRRWDSPNGPRFELEDLYRVTLDVTNGAFHD